MKINNNALKLWNVTMDDYLAWCKENKRASYLTKTKKEFFSKLRSGRLVKDSNGHLVKKRKTI